MNDKNWNLLLRVLSAIVLLPIVIALTYWGGVAFAVFGAMAAGACCFEMISMADRRRSLMLWVGVFGGFGLSLDMFSILGSSVAVILLLSTALLTISRPEDVPKPLGVTAFSWLYCAGLMSTLVTLRLRFGVGFTCLVYALTWLNDTGGYFAGRFFGKHKIYEAISPKKTWEGFAGGMVGSILGAFIVRAIWLPELTIAGCFIVAIPAGLIAPLGDFCESMLKRAFHVKDSGNVIPGHGGILDRVDALLFVSPWVLLFASLIWPNMLMMAQ